MACRVGMTTNPEERKQQWKGKHPNLVWRIIASDLSYSEAQKKEAEYARAHGCESSSGGRKIPGKNYSVYRFDY